MELFWLTLLIMILISLMIAKSQPTVVDSKPQISTYDIFDISEKQLQIIDTTIMNQIEFDMTELVTLGKSLSYKTIDKDLAKLSTSVKDSLTSDFFNQPSIYSQTYLINYIIQQSKKALLLQINSKPQ